MNPRRALISSLLLLAAIVLATACGNSGEPVQQQEVVRYIERPEASVAGGIAVPDGMTPDGIMVYAEGTSHIALTDGDGNFVLSRLPVGTYLLKASRSDLEPLTLEQVAITEEDLTRPQPFLNLGVIPMRARAVQHPPEITQLLNQGTLSGRVLTTDPADAEGAIVEIIGTQMRTVTIADGTYVFLNVPQGSYQLRFRKEGYRLQTTNVEVAASTETVVPDVRLTLVDPASISGRVIIGSVRKLDAEGAPIQGFQDVNVYLEGTPFNTTPANNGRFELPGLPGAVYTIMAQAPGFVLEQPFQVDLGEVEAAEVNLVLRQDPDAAVLLGMVVGQVYLEEPPQTGMAGVTVSLIGTNNIVMTDREGVFIIENVRPGTYDVVATMSGYENGLATDIEVAAGEPTAVPLIEMRKAVEAPKVVRTLPTPGATDVSITDPTLVLVTFSQKMDPGSVIDAISISPDVEYDVAIFGQHPLAREDQVVILLAGFTREGQPLRFNRRYTVTIDESASNMEGVPMEEDFAFSFTTGHAKIVSTWPNNGQRDVFVWLSSPIRVYFNAPVDASAVEYNADDIRIRPSLNTKPEVYFQNDGRTGWSYLSITGPFLHNEQYTVTLRGRIKTITGDPVSNLPYTFSFRTADRWEGLNRFDERSRDQMIEQEKRRK